MLLKREFIDVFLEEQNTNVTVKNIYQFDYGIKLHMYLPDMTKIPSVHFAADRAATAINVTPQISDDRKYFIVQIPNELLMMPRACFGYVYVQTGTAGYVEFVLNIPVMPRSRPSAYVLTQEQRNGYNEILASANAFIEDMRRDVSADGESILTQTRQLLGTIPTTVKQEMSGRLQDLDRQLADNLVKVNTLLSSTQDKIDYLMSRAERDLMAFGLVTTASGTEFTIDDSSDYYITDMSIFGKSTAVDDDEDGTYQWAHVVGNTDIKIGEDQVVKYNTGVHTLRGFPVPDGGNYEDEDGFQWWCDDIDMYKGVYTQRVYEYIPTTWTRGQNCWYTQIGQKQTVNPLVHTTWILNDKAELSYIIDAEYADKIVYSLDSDGHMHVYVDGMEIAGNASISGDMHDSTNWVLNEIAQLIAQIDPAYAGLITYERTDNNELLIHINDMADASKYDLSKGVACNIAPYVPCYCGCMGEGYCYVNEEKNRVVITGNSEEPPTGVVLLLALKYPVQFAANKIDGTDYHTTRTNTDIVSISGCGVKIEYYADIKTYIDKKLETCCRKEQVKPTHTCACNCGKHPQVWCAPCSSGDGTHQRDLVYFHHNNDNRWWLNPRADGPDWVDDHTKP